MELTTYSFLTAIIFGKIEKTRASEHFGPYALHRLRPEHAIGSRRQILRIYCASVKLQQVIKKYIAACLQNSEEYL